MSFTIFQNKKSPFQAIKTRSSKSRKIDIFPKGLTHGFGPKIAIFPNFFQAIKARKMSFTIFQNKKTPFQAIKTRSSKTHKIDIFPKGLTDGFGQRMPIFPSFLFFSHYRPGKSLLRYSRSKNRLSRIITKSSSQSRKIHIFVKGLKHGYGPKMAIFPTFFLGNKGQENVFYDFLERKNAFLACKNKKFKNSKN